MGQSDQVGWAEHIDDAETAKDDALAAAGRGQVITGYETLTL
jgi:hypothetical protein